MTGKNAISEIWYTRCPVPTPVGLAVQQGFLEAAFHKEGVTLNSIRDNADPKIRNSHFDHHLAYSFRHGGNVPPIRARSEGNPTRLVGITWTDEFQALLVAPESDIKTIADLKGRRFGVARRSDGIVDFMAATALKGLVSGLSLGGLTHRDVEIVDIPLTAGATAWEPVTDNAFGLRPRGSVGSEVAALVRGDVDAIFLKGTGGIAAAQLLGLRPVVEFGFHPDPRIRINSGSPRVLTVDGALADERPDLVAVILRTLKQTDAWARAHPDEVRHFVARETNASEQVVGFANGPELHHHLGIGLEPELIDAIDHYKDFLFEWGFLAADFSVSEWVDDRAWALLKEVEPA